MEETGIPGEDHQPAASHWKTFALCCTFCSFTCFHVFSSLLWYQLWFLRKTILRSSPIWFVGGSCFICHFNLHTHTDIQHVFHIRWYTGCLTVARGVPIVKQELFTFPEYLTSPAGFRFLCNVLSSIVCRFFPFLLTIVLFVLHYGFWLPSLVYSDFSSNKPYVYIFSSFVVAKSVSFSKQKPLY